MTNIIVKTDKKYRDKILNEFRNEILDRVFEFGNSFDISYYEICGLLNEIKLEALNVLNSEEDE